eukprot:scaffold38830_cov67-Phaeocystis_antarctica.AAC.1
MRKSCAAKARSCVGSAKVPVTGCTAMGLVAGAASLGLELAATGASRSGSSLSGVPAAISRISAGHTREFCTNFDNHVAGQEAALRKQAVFDIICRVKGEHVWTRRFLGEMFLPEVREY